MKKIALIIMAFWVTMAAHAQTATQYLELINHQELINPAYHGGKKGASALLLYGEKWSGFEGAPKTTGFNARYGLNDFFGIALKGDFEKMGHRKTNLLGANADVNVRLSQHSFLAFGLYVGAEMWRYSLQDALAGDPSLLIENYDRNSPVGGFGLTYRWKKLVVGASSYISFYKDEPNMTTSYLFVEYTQPVATDWGVRPMALYHYNNKLDDFWELGAMAEFRGFASLGVSYRDRQGVNILANVEFLEFLSVGCCYGINTGKLADLSKKSFEISVGFKMNKD